MSPDKARLDEEFSALYKAHLRDVYSYSYYRVGNHHDAEDLTEQTFLQAYRHFERAQRESEGLDSVPLIAESVGRAGIAAPGLDGLAALIEGSIDPGEWVAGLRRAERARRAAA